MKRGPVHRLMTRLAAEQRATRVTGRRVRILNVLGLRAQESPRRALKLPFSCDQRATNTTVRLVDEWLPIHAWTASQVWALPGGIASDARIRPAAHSTCTDISLSKRRARPVWASRRLGLRI
jgi:hypothetical protein